MTHRIVKIPMTFSDFQGHLLTASIFKVGTTQHHIDFQVM